MANNSGCECPLLLVGIISAWYIYHSCDEKLHGKATQMCFNLCLVKTIGGTILRLMECCYMNEHPHDRNCRFYSDLFTSILTDMPLLGLSILMITDKQMCPGHKAINFSNILSAFRINGLVSLIQSVYHLVKSCKNNWHFATVHAILAGFVIFLQSNCVL